MWKPFSMKNQYLYLPTIKYLQVSFRIGELCTASFKASMAARALPRYLLELHVIQLEDVIVLFSGLGGSDGDGLGSLRHDGLGGIDGDGLGGIDGDGLGSLRHYGLGVLHEAVVDLDDLRSWT
jgi:hypothetical protein